MKVLFLDVDGVLNTPKLIRNFGFDHIDEVLVALVARIVRETGSEIVLSSTWRIQEKDRKLVEDALSRHGLKIRDCTPVITRGSGGWTEGGWVRRHEEIEAWLQTNEAKRFAILDDFEDAEIGGSFFKTDEDVGLTAEIAERVIRHLNGG
jgi:hypothetical protein